MDWRQQGKIWQLKPAQPVGQVDFIGGSYLAATPQVSYRRLLEDLSNSGLVINAWAYVPGFDHQSQARDCLLYTSPSPRDQEASRMPSSA